MKRTALFNVLAAVVAFSFLAACAAPVATPVVVKETVQVPVPQTVVSKQTVVVPQTVAAPTDNSRR